MNPGRIFGVVLIVTLVATVSGVASDAGHLVIGGEDEGDGMVFYPRQVEEGPDGNIYVLDSGDSFIKVFSPGGDYLRRIAGPGEGPGEFQRTDGATFGFMPDGMLFFTEFYGGHRWITIMKLDGDLVRVLSPKLNADFGIEAAAALEDGSFLVQFAHSTVSEASRDYFLYRMPRSLARIDGEGGIVAEITRADCVRMISYSPNGGTSNLPFTPSFAWVVGGDGTVTWSDGMSPRLGVFDCTGKHLREVETTMPDAEKVTKGDLTEWKRSRKEMMMSRNPAWWHEFGRVVEEYDKSLYDKPILRRISGTPSGNLLVESPWDTDADGATYRLLDMQGAIVATVTAGAWDLHYSEHFLLFLTVDDEGNVLVNAVDRPVDDADALSRMIAITDFAGD